MMRRIVFYMVLIILLFHVAKNKPSIAQVFIKLLPYFLYDWFDFLKAFLLKNTVGFTSIPTLSNVVYL